MTEWLRRIALGLMALFLCAGLAVDTSAIPRVFGIGLEDTSTMIEVRLNRTPGVRQRIERSHRDGSIERRYFLNDDSFVRVVYTDAKESTLPTFLSFDLGTSAQGEVSKTQSVLGPPDWRHSDHDVVREIWGGVGTSEGGVKVRPEARSVITIAIPNKRMPTVVLARPSWFTSQGGR